MYSIYINIYILQEFVTWVILLQNTAFGSVQKNVYRIFPSRFKIVYLLHGVLNTYSYSFWYGWF